MKRLRNLVLRDGVNRRHRRISSLRIGVLFIVAVLVLGVVLFNKDQIITTLRPGQTIKIHFARGFRLVPYYSKVKVSFVPVGQVTDVTKEADGSAMVSAKLDDGVAEKLRSNPTATLRPTTLLGGNYFVDLKPGGSPGRFRGIIPTQRTRLPVELGNIANALQPPALHGLQNTTGNVDETLKNGGGPALDRLLSNAPGTLDPAGKVLQSAQGNDPQTDLPNLVHGLRSTSAVLSQRQGQLDSIVTNLHTTSSTLDQTSKPLARTVADLPDTVHETNAGLQRLGATLDKVRDTAAVSRPTVQELNTTLNHVNPVLARTVPFVRQLNSVLQDAQPLVEQLVPASQQTNDVLHDVDGPVLDRVNGPVKKFILSPYTGTGPYASSRSDRPMYQEIGGAVANLDKTSSYFDQNGHAVSIQVGAGAGTAGGLPVSAENMLNQLMTTLHQSGQEGR